MEHRSDFSTTKVGNEKSITYTISIELQQIIDLIKDNERLRVEIEKLRTEIKKLRRENNKLKKQIQELKHKVFELEASINACLEVYGLWLLSN